MGQIPFASIPPNLRIPLAWTEFDNSQAGVGQDNQRSLIVAQTINAAPLALAFCASPEQAASLYGANSQLALMVAEYRLVDPFGELWVLPVTDNGSGTAATGAIAFTGTAMANGTLSAYIAGELVSVPVTVGMTAAQLATALAAAANAVSDLPVTASVNTGTVTFTADNKGTVGNQLDIRLNYRGLASGEQLPAGITAAITAMSGGATDPVLTGLDAVLGDEAFDFIAVPWSSSAALDALKTLMAGRWDWSRGLYGGIWSAKMGADATGADLLTFGATRNDPHVVVVGYEPSPNTPMAVAAANCARAAIYLKADPARPLQTGPLPGLMAPPAGGRFTKSVQQALLSTGVALMSYARDGSCQILRHVTTYQSNDFGQPDQSYLDCETLFTLMAITRRLKNAVTQKFARQKLADDGTNFGAGAPIVTPKSFRSEMIAQYASMIDLGWVEDMAGFQQGLLVQRSIQDPTRLDVLFTPYLVTGLRIIAILNQFRLQAA